MPVIIPEHVTHSSVTIKDAEPVSAGFFTLDNGIKVTGRSQSLNLEPMPALDQCLLTATLANAGMYAFLTL